MNKQAISVTLDANNLTWPKGRIAVTGARRHGVGRPKRSVVGDVEINAADPDLLTADAAIRSLFEESLGQVPPRCGRTNAPAGLGDRRH